MGDMNRDTTNMFASQDDGKILIGWDNVPVKYSLVDTAARTSQDFNIHDGDNHYRDLLSRDGGTLYTVDLNGAIIKYDLGELPQPAADKPDMETRNFNWF